MRQLIRKAGQAVRGMPEVVGNKARQIDDNYSQFLQDTIKPDQIRPGNRMDQMREAVAYTVGRPLSATDTMGGDDSGRMSAGNILKAVGATTRYGIPAVGVAAAGKGLIDLTGMFIQQNEQTSGTLMP